MSRRDNFPLLGIGRIDEEFISRRDQRKINRMPFLRGKMAAEIRREKEAKRIHIFEDSSLGELENYIAKGRIDLIQVQSLFQKAVNFLLRDLREIKGPWTLANHTKSDRYSRDYNRRILVNYCQRVNQLAAKVLKSLNEDEAENFLDFIFDLHCRGLLKNKNIFPASFDSANDFTELCGFVMNPALASTEQMFLEAKSKPVNARVLEVLNKVFSSIEIDRIKQFPWTFVEVSKIDHDDMGLKQDDISSAFIATDCVDQLETFYGDGIKDSVVGHEMTHVILDLLGCTPDRKIYHSRKDDEDHPLRKAQEYVAEMVYCQFVPEMKLYEAIFFDDLNEEDDFIYESAKEFCLERYSYDLARIKELDIPEGEVSPSQNRNYFNFFIEELKKNLGENGLEELREYIKVKTLEQAQETVIQLAKHNAFDPYKIHEFKNLTLAA